VSTSLAIGVIVGFLALDILFYYLIIKRMERPSPSAAFARARGFSVIPDSEGESVGLRLRERLAVPRGDLYDIVRLPLAEGEGYLFSTLPMADSHLPRTRETKRQFIAVLTGTPIDGGLFIHPPVRPPFRRFKRRRLFRVFKTGAFLPVSADRLPGLPAGQYRACIENEAVDPGRFLTAGAVRALARAPRRRGFALLICRGGFVLYINPLLVRREEAERFYDFTVELVGAFSKAAR
jgi:hypothetical protein